MLICTVERLFINRLMDSKCLHTFYGEAASYNVSHVIAGLWSPLTLLLSSSDDNIRAAAARVAESSLPSEEGERALAGMQPYACSTHVHLMLTLWPFCQVFGMFCISAAQSGVLGCRFIRTVA